MRLEYLKAKGKQARGGIPAEVEGVLSFTYNPGTKVLTVFYLEKDETISNVIAIAGSVLDNQPADWDEEINGPWYR